jgi:hypothetical protein
MCFASIDIEGDAMDGERRRLEDLVVVADRHVKVGQVLVDRQRNNIAALRRDGQSIELATKLLAELEQSLRLHIEDRKRLRRALAKLSARYSNPKTKPRRLKGLSAN